MALDIAMTCPNSSTFCTNQETYIICKPYRKLCKDVVAEGLCTGKHKDDNKVDDQSGKGVADEI